jgi:2-keto-4-pentenoate hydratase/2-oxohepta-3-ene-1,7-dioic acid hydratase in catechol pathway
MRIIRYRDPSQNVKYAALQADETALEISGDIYGKYSVTNKTAQVSKLLAPVVPVSILCIGLNYRRHAEECGAPYPKYPILFLKAPATLQNPGDPIVLPRHLRSDKVDWEAELAVVIGRTCKNVSRDRALDYVLGYSCSNDVSARDWQANAGGDQWCRGKGFDTFAPLGPCLTTTDEIPDPHALKIKFDIDGEVLQDWTTGDMIHDIPSIIEFLSGSTTLPPGTVILTGTPQGVGGAMKPQRFMKAGEVATVTIEKIGSLTNPVIEEVV